MKCVDSTILMFEKRFFQVGIFAIMLVFGVQCDESFEPREENTEYFYSMYGYLDATVDTQWVRIVPVRDNFDPSPDEIDIEVTLRNIDTGEQVIMNDSLFNPNPLVVYWNFWTTMPIEPEATYELTAIRSDGVESTSIVTIPPDFPTPIYIELNGDELIVVRDVNRVADVTAVWRIQETFRNQIYTYSFSHIRDSLQSPFGFSNEILFRLDGNRDIGLIKRNFPDVEIVVLDRQVFVASAGPEWINLYELDEDIYTLAEGVSNVDNGVGFMLGTITKTIPWEPCFAEVNGQTTFAPCELETRLR